MSPGDHAAPIVLVTWPDYDVDHPALGGALTAAGLELRLAPKLGARTPDELADLLGGAVGAIVSTDPFTADVLRAAVDLRVIARVGVGVDSIDLDAASERGVQVATTPGANEQAVADHAVGLMLAVLRRIPELDQDVRDGGWHRTGPFTPRQLTGATVGLVGYGHIGRRVASRLRGFDVELLVHDPALPAGGPETSIALDDLLGRSDVVSLHCPLIASTRHLIDARALGLMRPEAVLVNTSRGGVVDERALVARAPRRVDRRRRARRVRGRAARRVPTARARQRGCEPAQRRSEHRLRRRDDAAGDPGRARRRRGRRRRGPRERRGARRATPASVVRAGKGAGG